MAEPGINRIPSELLEMITDSLGRTELCALRSTCRTINARTLEIMHERVYSRRPKWLTTTLMGSDLQRLEAIARNSDLSKYIETIDLEDHSYRNRYEPWRGISPGVWPRDAAGLIDSSGMGLASLNAMLASGKLCPRKISVINGYVGELGEMNKAPATAKLAKEIWQGTGLALEQVDMSLSPQGATTLHVQPQSAGQALGTSRLKSANLVPSQDIDLFWTTQALYHAPALESLAIVMGRGPEHATLPDRMLAAGPPVASLMHCNLNVASVSTFGISTLLASSHHTLRSLELRRVNVYGSTWKKLLTHIAHHCEGLTSFSLNRLWQGPNPPEGASDFRWFPPMPYGTDTGDSDYPIHVVFKDFDAASVPMDGRTRLELNTFRGDKLTMVGYSGTHASEVLAYAASTVELSFS